MKKLMLITLSSAALLSLAACATPDAAKPADGTTTAAATEKPKMFCEREGTTGSMLTKKQCSPVPTEADRARLANELQGIVRSTGSQPGGK
ncbi:hypothetical protein [Roseateles sp.]|uniref:hypothetical protein n=1 Tax=Roseateles sp. TaxID=1971397 RepID=UPI0031D5D290